MCSVSECVCAFVCIFKKISQNSINLFLTYNCVVNQYAYMCVCVHITIHLITTCMCTPKYSQTCIKRSWPLGQKKTWPYKRFNSYKVFYDRAIKWWPFNTGDCLIEVYEVFYDRAIKWWPFNTGDCLIEVTTRAGLTVFV